jgi:hypothetical protein
MEVIVCSFLVLFGKSKVTSFSDFVYRFHPRIFFKERVVSKVAACILLVFYLNVVVVFGSFGFFQNKAKK